jgi:replicative DNA helicase
MASTLSDGNVASLRDDEIERTEIRVPPHNAEIEAALLGAILTNNRAFERVGDFLRAEHFYEPVHGRIYAALEKLIEQGQIGSPLTLKHYFEKDEALAAVGGSQYLFDLAASVVTVINAVDYGRTIYDLFLRRQLIELGEDIVNDAYEPEIDSPATGQIETAEQRLYDLSNSGELERGYVSLGDAARMAVESAEEAFRRDSHVVGITTGLRDLDNKLGGLHPSDLLILAGRPAMGKSALAANIAFNAAEAYKERVDENGRTITEGGHVLFFSLEMSAEQLAARILSEQARISSDAIRRGDITSEEFNRLVVASQKLHRLPLYLDDSPGLSISGLRTRARRLKRQKKLHMVVVDYLQLLQPAPGRRTDNRVQEISEITRGLKMLAKELEVPVLALSQLSRQVEQREDKRPQLADLRESGSIEQDADVVMFIFREEYYLEKGEPIQGLEEAQEKFSSRSEQWAERLEHVRNTASVIIAKQRHGPVGTIDLYFDGKFTHFDDLDRQHGDDEFP